MNLFTSESVTVGHPDKICDQIADRILDECLSKDPQSHVACEVCCTTGTIILMGEITTSAVINYKELAREVLEDIGYTNPDYGIDARSCSVIDLIDKQSPEINNAVLNSLENRSITDKVASYDIQGAGDQGIIFGYACNETEYLMPMSLVLSDEIARGLEKLRISGTVKWLRPDGKTQVTVQYDGDRISRIDTILVSAQHGPGVSYKDINSTIIDGLIINTLESLGVFNLAINTSFIVNPSGSFTIGGPNGDTGLTGRKLAVDTYGGHAKFGGGALSGKCPSKVDRSAAYMSRYVAKHVVASGLADKCEVQVSYAIGKAAPVSVNVSTFGTGRLPDDKICKLVNYYFDFRPLAIINNLKLLDTRYYNVSKRSHFLDVNAPWEILDDKILEVLRSELVTV